MLVRAGRAAGITKMEGDGLLRRPQIFPEPWIGLITVQQDLDEVTWLQRCASGPRGHQRKRWFADGDLLSVRRHTADVTDHAAARDMEKSDEREGEHDRHRGPSSESTQRKAGTVPQEVGAAVSLHLSHELSCDGRRSRHDAASVDGLARRRLTSEY